MARDWGELVSQPLARPAGSARGWHSQASPRAAPFLVCRVVLCPKGILSVAEGPEPQGSRSQQG